MGVYIKGMEMPKGCFECPMRRKVDPDTIKCLATGERFEETFAGTIETRNRGNCPLVPIPPHGDLIDRDELMKHKGNCYDADGHLLYAVGTGSIMCAPTIIPAEEGERWN